MRRSLKPSALAGVLVLISGLGLSESVKRYVLLGAALETVTVIAPLERDYVAESVEHLVKNQPGGDSAVNMVRGRLNEANTMHRGWLSFVSGARGLFQTQGILWGTAFMVSLGLYFVLWRGEQKRE